MSEAEAAALPDTEEVVSAAPRNWKKIAVFGGAAVVGLLLLIGMVLALVSLFSGKKSEPAKPGAAPAHQVSIAPPVNPAASAPAPKPAVDEAALTERQRLEEEIKILREQRTTLLKEQAELARKKKLAQKQAAPALSGERECRLSGDPQLRRQELRVCFGLASEPASSAQASAATASGATASASQAKTGQPAPAPSLGKTPSKTDKKIADKKIADHSPAAAH